MNKEMWSVYFVIENNVLTTELIKTTKIVFLNFVNVITKLIRKFPFFKTKSFMWLFRLQRIAPIHITRVQMSIRAQPLRWSWIETNKRRGLWHSGWYEIHQNLLLLSFEYLPNYWEFICLYMGWLENRCFVSGLLITSLQGKEFSIFSSYIE